MKLKTIDYKTFQERRKLLKKINENLTKDQALQEYKEEEEKLVKENEVMFFPHTPNSPTPEMNTLLYRATLPYPGFDEESLDSFSYPKSPELNRCNIPRQPVFYCSDKCYVSINESLKAQNINSFPFHLYLSIWRVKITKKWKILPLIFFPLAKINPLHDFAQRNEQEVIEKYQKYLRKEDIKNYIKFYHDEFRKINCYEFSSIISHKYLYDDENDAILYPSVQENAEGNNYAFNPKYINNNDIVLDETYRFRIEKKDDEYSWYLEAKGSLNAGKIEWSLL